MPPKLLPVPAAGVGIAIQLVPFHCSASACRVVESVPAAKQRVALTHDTAWSSPPLGVDGAVHVVGEADSVATAMLVDDAITTIAANPAMNGVPTRARTIR